MSRRIYSLGHSTHSFDRFVGLCAGAGIEVIADVRRSPRSRRNPQFSRENLELNLPARGIAYVWLGESLGGFRDEGYEEWMKADEFGRGIAGVERLACERTVAFMCSEGLPGRCHRRFVADALASRGHEVAHLLPDGQTVSVPAPLEL